MKAASSVKRKYASGYVKSPGRKKRVRQAIYGVKNQKITPRKACEECKYSNECLQRRLSGEIDIGSRNGPAPVFLKEEEKAMAEWLCEMAERGMELKPPEFLDLIQNIALNVKKRHSKMVVQIMTGIMHSWHEIRK